MYINIGNTNLTIETDISSLEEDINTPNAHSLHTNWLYSTENNSSISGTIIIKEQVQKKVSVILDKNILKIVGDFSAIKQKGFNPQFSISGNKGIISKFISHINEVNNIASLHACALYHPDTGKILIGIGASGSGKTAFISSGIQSGWHIIATEMLQIHEDGTIFPGNYFDTIGQNAINFFHSQKELSPIIFESKTIFDQTGYKCLADFSEYATKKQYFNISNADIVFLQFGNQKFQNAEKVYDRDMSLRFIGHSASEKIEVPTYIGNDLVSLNLHGNANVRNRIVHLLHRAITGQVILGGNIENFQHFLQKKF